MLNKTTDLQKIKMEYMYPPHSQSTDPNLSADDNSEL